MKEFLRCHAMESMCRQRAAFHSEESRKFLAEAGMWKRRALNQISFHFAECNTTESTTPKLHLTA
ncbi:hypothetical protein V1281_003285 [Nitrobacteraceae bacterium AZCC 2161]